MKIVVLWVVACSLVEVYRRFRGDCCLHRQGVSRSLENFDLQYLILSAFRDKLLI
jgi:hypothetical protein